MAQERLSMRKFKEVLRLKHHCALSNRQIAHSCQIARSTVSEYLWRAEQAGIGWAEAEPMQDVSGDVSGDVVPIFPLPPKLL